MEKIKQHLNQAEKKLQLEWQEKENRILADIEQTKKEITDLAERADFSPFAIADFEKDSLDGVSENKNLPELVRIGRLNPVNFSGAMPEIPMLLPFSENAVSFNVADNANTLFELTALRLMLSLPQNLAKFYFVDNNLGSDFARMTKIDKKIADYYQIISNPQERNKLFADLEQVVSDFNLQHKASFPSLKEYNKTAGEMQKPYHFVFINNFPAGFTTETAEKLLTFINNGNASKAGIFIFFSIDENKDPKYGIDIEKFKENSAYISKKSRSECKIENSVFPSEFNNKFNIELDKFLPTNIEQIIDLINKKEVAKTEISFENVYKKMLQQSKIWQKNTIEKIEIPIGYVNPKQKQYLEFSEKANNYFGLIGGLPGYGKTVLLHNIILWGAMEYSPLELRYYLIDCKKGVGFNAYQDLPHTDVISLYNDYTYCASLLDKLIVEMERRTDLFKAIGNELDKDIEKIEDYRRITNEQMPRILAIVDEFEVLFQKDDKTARAIRQKLEHLINQGRFAGIHILLCSQTVTNLDALAVIKKITWRLSFSLSAIDSERILRNDRASTLTEKGNALLNTTQSGDKKANINFRVGNVVVENIRKNYIKPLKTVSAERYPDIKLEEKFISDGDTNARIEKNETLKNNIINNSFKVNDVWCDVYIGEPTFIRPEHAKIRIRKEAGSNLVLVGSDVKSAVSIIGLVNYQLMRQSTAQSKFYIIDCFGVDDEQFSGCFNFAKKHFPENVSVFKSGRIEEVIDEIEAELKLRIEKDKNEEKIDGRIVLSIVNMQRCQALKKDGYNDSSVTKKLLEILKKGADVGIHVLLYSRTYSGLTDALGIGGVVNNCFENRIALDGGKSVSIITEQTGTKITEDGTALLQILQPPKDFMTYNPDLIRVYSQCDIDENSADVDFIVELLKDRV